MEQELNPYAAPKADGVMASADAGVPRRPRVVKWTTFLLGLFTFIVIYFYWRTIADRGAAEVFKHQPLFDLPLAMAVAFLLCLFRRRDKVSFGIVVFTLGWLCVRTVERLWPRWTTPRAFATPWIAERIVELLFAAGFFYLFYRFTFGLPSRAYFGFAAPSRAAQPAQTSQGGAQ